jgi:hypothetical protein
MRKTAILLLPLGLAYAYAVIALGHTSAVYYDSEQYVAYGRNLLDSGAYGIIAGVPDTHREPGYGAYLAGGFAFLRAIGLVPDLAAVSDVARIFWVKVAQALTLFGAAAFAASSLPPRVRRIFFALLSPARAAGLSPPA